jgi:hypothetical protein
MDSYSTHFHIYHPLSFHAATRTIHLFYLVELAVLAAQICLYAFNAFAARGEFSGTVSFGDVF